MDPVEQARQAFRKDDVPAVRRLLEQHPELKARINDPTNEFGQSPITAARSRAMLDLLLEAGADIDAKSDWWAGGFGILHTASPDLAAYAIERGAKVDVHAAARLGLVDDLRERIAADPALVHAPGGDGQTPLHFASTIEIVDLLLAAGADIDARDVDHESTPAQYMVRDRQPIANHLVARGCATDLLLLTALGDAERVRRLLNAEPECVRLRVSDEFFPMVGGKTGGTIYQWALGWYVSAHQVARAFGHEDLFELLTGRSPVDVQYVAALWLGDRERIETLRRATPDIASRLTQSDRRQLAHAARNNDTAAALRMLEAGLPVDGRSQHGATPLHWAAWHGNVALVRAILRHAPPIENAETEFGGTPLRWAIHGSENGWYRGEGDYAATVESLIDAGARLPSELAGSAAVRDALRRHGIS
jgi:ankyrin repeat protein